MEKLNDFLIPYKSLSLEEHTFKADVRDSFFEVYQNSDIQKGELKAIISLNKKSTHVEFNFKIVGVVELVCDRCLGKFDFPINIDQNLYVKFGKTYQEEDENLYILPETDDTIDASVFVNELLTVAIPMRHIHSEDEEGNPTCPNKLFDYIENVTNEDEGTIDPRWSELNKLKNGTS